MDEIISKFVRKHLNLLLLEREENLQHFFNDISPANLHKLECIGQALTKLTITNVACKGPERFQIDLERVGGLPLEHRLSNGDLIICIRSKEKGPTIRAIVIAIGESTLSISTSNQCQNVEEDETFTIVKTDSDFTYNSQTRALHFLEKKELYSSCCLQIAQILFDIDKDKVHDLLTAEDPIHKAILNNEGNLKFANHNLVKDQRSAVEFAIKRRYFAIIQGPPGTGKTTTLIETIVQLYRLGKKILICAPTNVAVDNLVVRLGETEAKPLRLGHPTRISTDAIKYSLDAHLERDDGYIVLRELKKAIKNIELNIETNGTTYLYKETRELKKEYKKRLTKLTCDIFKRCSVILCTLNSSSFSDNQLKNVKKNSFDVLIVDEASQAMEASMWIAIPNVPKVILAGDINQLPPVVMSEEATKGGLNISLMERAIKNLKDKCYVQLTRQYRMNEKIMTWSNKKFYNNTLKADTSVKNHLLKDLPHIESDNYLTNEAVVYIDTCGCECEEFNTGIESGSKGNLGEVVVVDKIVTNLIKACLRHKDIGVISPYSLQVDFIRKSFAAKSIKVEVSTVDGFQGREKEVIILSLVRSNLDRELGFVTDFRRLNVAVTRARRLLVVIADSETMEKDELIVSLLKHIEDHGLIQTAEEYLSQSIDKEIEQITKSSQSILKQNVKLKAGKIKSVKQEKKKEVEISESKDKKKLPEKIKAKPIPKLSKNKGIDLSTSLNRNKYNIFETIDTENSDEVEVASQKFEEKSLDSEIPENFNTKKRERRTQEKLNTGNETVKADGFDKVLEEFIKSNFVCSFDGCKKSTKLIKLICEFCKKWFCIEHGVQEVHGCGNAIRRKEHKAFRHRKPEAITKYDKDKFTRKIKKLEEARKPKAKPKK